MNTAEQFIEALYKAGWNSPNDAQHHHIIALLNKLYKKEGVCLQCGWRFNPLLSPPAAKSRKMGEEIAAKDSKCSVCGTDLKAEEDCSGCSLNRTIENFWRRQNGE